MRALRSVGGVIRRRVPCARHYQHHVHIELVVAADDDAYRKSGSSGYFLTSHISLTTSAHNLNYLSIPLIFELRSSNLDS